MVVVVILEEKGGVGQSENVCVCVFVCCVMSVGVLTRGMVETKRVGVRVRGREIYNKRERERKREGQGQGARRKESGTR